ncbi:hypothetical protein GGX14DRAFT_453289, partial [Mycena pura]
MFILPAAAHPGPFDLAPKSFTGAAAWHPWLAPLRLPLLLLATLVVFALVRAILALRRPIPIPVAVVEKLGKAPVAIAEPKADAGAESEAQAPGSKRTLFGFLKWETLPPISLAEALPITLNPPPPPPMRGGHVYRGGRGVGFVRRPEPALSTRPPVEVPRMCLCHLCGSQAHQAYAAVPAIYDTQTPASMAKLIMSRHVRPVLSPWLTLPLFFLPPLSSLILRTTRHAASSFLPLPLLHPTLAPLSSNALPHTPFPWVFRLFRAFPPILFCAFPPISLRTAAPAPSHPPPPAARRQYNTPRNRNRNRNRNIRRNEEYLSACTTYLYTAEGGSGARCVLVDTEVGWGGVGWC